MQEDRSDAFGEADFDMNDNHRSNVFVSYPDGNVSISQDFGAFNLNNSNLSFLNNDESYQEIQGHTSEAQAQHGAQQSQQHPNPNTVQPGLRQQKISLYNSTQQRNVQNVNMESDEQYTAISQQFYQHLMSLHREKQNRDIRRHPRVGHRDLDVYALFLAVQARGGYGHILQWKELGADLRLPATVTNAGYVLRAKYDSLILPFEQELLDEFWPPGKAPRPATHQPLTGPTENVQRQLRSSGDNQLTPSYHRNGNTNINKNNNGHDIRQIVENQINNVYNQSNFQRHSDLQYEKNNVYTTTGQTQVQVGTAQSTHIVPTGQSNYLCLFRDQKEDDFQQKYTMNAQHVPLQRQQPINMHAHDQQQDIVGASLKEIILPNLDVDDTLFETLLAQNPGLENLTIGSLRNVTRIPGGFPRNLRSLALLDVPRRLIPDVLRVIASLRLRHLKVTQYTADGAQTPTGWGGDQGAGTQAQDSLD